MNVFDNCEYNFGVLDKAVSKLGILSFESAINAVKNQQADVLITAPINKNASYSSRFKFSGQTDYLSSFFNVEALMLMVSEHLKIALTTDHIPLKEVHNVLNKDLIKRKNVILNKTLQDDSNGKTSDQVLFDISQKKLALIAVDKYAPAKATKIPFTASALYLIRFTLIPAVSTAFGFSPTARILKPKLVLKTIQ